MTREELDRLEALEKAATPGPWVAKEPAFAPGIGKAAVFGPKPNGTHEGRQCIALADAEFIAAARTAVPALLDALERSERIASNLDAVNKAIYRSMSEICGVAVDGFSDIQPVLMGLRVDADLFYSIKAENAALRERVAVLETVREAAGALADELDRRAGGNDWPMDLGDYGDALTDALDKADKTDKEGA